MTGIEKLRDYAEKLKGADRYEAVATNIEALSYQIESETLPRPLFEDGEPVQFGDKFDADGKTHAVDGVAFIRDGTFYLINGVRMTRYRSGESVKRPENTELFDSWERIEEDAMKSSCDYFKSDRECIGCRAFKYGEECSAIKAKDLVRRCRALAEKEAGR